MIDDEGTHRARRVGGLGPLDQPRVGRDAARRTPARRASQSPSAIGVNVPKRC